VPLDVWPLIDLLVGAEQGAQTEEDADLSEKCQHPEPGRHTAGVVPDKKANARRKQDSDD